MKIVAFHRLNTYALSENLHFSKVSEHPLQKLCCLYFTYHYGGQSLCIIYIDFI